MGHMGIQFRDVFFPETNYHQYDNWVWYQKLLGRKTLEIMENPQTRETVLKLKRQYFPN